MWLRLMGLYSLIHTLYVLYYDVTWLINSISHSMVDIQVYNDCTRAFQIIWTVARFTVIAENFVYIIICNSIRKSLQ